jgi:hypothetical protein
VSTDTTGSPRRRWRHTWSLMYSNWSLRSGCWAPSTTLVLDYRSSPSAPTRSRCPGPLSAGRTTPVLSSRATCSALVNRVILEMPVVTASLNGSRVKGSALLVGEPFEGTLGRSRSDVRPRILASTQVDSELHGLKPELPWNRRVAESWHRWTPLRGPSARLHGSRPLWSWGELALGQRAQTVPTIGIGPVHTRREDT